MKFVFTPHQAPSVPVIDTEERFPVHRVYCVGRNYGDHVREMGGDPKAEPPVFFSKPATSIVVDGEDVNYPQATTDLHHEVELVVALKAGGRAIAIEDASACIYGYAVGIDLTRRDLQDLAKKGGRPWDVAKGFDQSAPISAIRPVDQGSHLSSGNISLQVNGELRQDGNLSEMIWAVPEIISSLSDFYQLKSGDLIFTGTPAGVSAINVGDHLRAAIDGVGEVELNMLAAAR